MKIAYTSPKNIHSATKKLLDKIIPITDEYLKDGLTLSLRQLFYLVFGEGIFPENNKQYYHKLSRLMTDARNWGWVDWDVIVDRLREPRKHAEWDDIPDLVHSAIDSYRKDRHKEQENYIEVWVEKDALSEVLGSITDKYHVTLMVDRGYGSTSALRESAQRFVNAEKQGKHCIILYLGDHDPSGIDMVRDIQKRLGVYHATVDVKIIALTKEQIEKYQLPPNAAKTKDSRSKGYILTHGPVSWELDALRPKILNQILTDYLESLIDMDKYNKIIDEEEIEKEKLIQFAETFDTEED